MTKLTTEITIEKLQYRINAHENDITQMWTADYFLSVQKELLALKQAAKNPVAWVATDSEGFPEYSGHNEFSSSCGAGTPLYAAPVLPKQPERVMKHSSVIAEQLEHVLSSMDVTDHQRAVISCAIDRLNKSAEILQQKPTALIAPEKLDYQSAKDLFNYLMNEEETNATVNGWNACRAEMLKAQPVSEPYKLEIDMDDADHFSITHLYEIIYGKELIWPEAKLLARFMLDVKQRVSAAPAQESK